MTTANERLIKILSGMKTDRPACICPGGMMNMVTKALQDACGVYLPEAHTDARMMADLRQNVPSSIGGAKVTAVRDYKTSTATNLETGENSIIELPKSNVLEFLLGNNGSVIVRPSGTEPKVKFYYTAVAESKEEASQLLDRMIKQMSV